ncbi:uncharacterized protein JCM15063_000817 [Sporobolomyces koalae]|uniref:uncharacterized protein n=1 Tax=Sporobolomyces koalae TaxID=500713 RepID=UPI003180938C
MSTCRYSWSSASSSVPAWDHGSPTSPESESISSASSYFDPFNDTTFGPDLNSNRRILHLEDGLNAMWRAQVKDCTRKAEEWRWKCYQLSDEVARLRHQVDQLKRDRDDLQLETIATGTANLVFGLNNDDDTGSFIQTTLPTAPVSCRWDGKRWVPVVPVATFKPQIDPTKSMSKQNPPPW